MLVTHIHYHSFFKFFLTLYSSLIFYYPSLHFSYISSAACLVLCEARRASSGGRAGSKQRQGTLLRFTCFVWRCVFVCVYDGVAAPATIRGLEGRHVFIHIPFLSFFLIFLWRGEDYGVVQRIKRRRKKKRRKKMEKNDAFPSAFFLSLSFLQFFSFQFSFSSSRCHFLEGERGSKKNFAFRDSGASLVFFPFFLFLVFVLIFLSITFLNFSFHESRLMDEA